MTFFLLAFVAAWACWGAAAAILRANPGADLVLAALAGALLLLGTISPALAAIALTDRREGRAATLALLRRVVQFDAGVRWYIFAVGYIPAIKLSAAVVHRAATGGWPRFGQEPWYLMAAAILISVWAQAGEEIGWRGYSLPRLANRFGLGPASLILGIVWAVWHAPLFVFRASDLVGQSLPLYVLQVTAYSVAMAWLYWRTNGSLFLVMLMHAAGNNLKDIVPSGVEGATHALALSTSLVAWLTVALLWLCAAFFLWQMSKARRSFLAPAGGGAIVHSS